MRKTIARPKAVAIDAPDDAGRRLLLFALFTAALVIVPAIFA